MLQAAAGALLALAVGLCVVPLGRDWHEAPAVLHGRAVASGHGEGILLAGAAEVRIPLSDYPILAGYAGYRRGERTEPVYARAIALEAGGYRAYIGVIDTLLISGDLEREVLRRAGLDPRTCVMLAATHTHTGPGGTWDNAIAGWAGAGPFDPEQRDAIADAAAEALTEARAALYPAELRVAREEWTLGPARPRSEGPIDPELVVAWLRGPGAMEIATLIDYAMHPTSAPRGHLSPDWPGRVPAMVVQGAVGNTTWARGEPLAPAVVAESARILAGAKPQRELKLACETRIVTLPPAQASPATPWVLRRAWTNVLALSLEQFAVQTRLTVGSLQLIGVPGEPVGELGLAARPAVLVGLADGYVGYVESAARWQTGRGESSRTYFGPELARALGIAPR